MGEKFLKLEELTSKTLNSLDREKTIFFMTLSPLENHGEHLPLGMDLLEGEAIAQGVAEKFRNEYSDWNIIFCPSVTMGYGLMPGVGSLNIRQSVVRDFLIDYLAALAKKGFRYIFISGFHGGPKHLVAVDEAIHYINKKYGTKIIAPFGYCISHIQADKMKLPNEELQYLFEKNRGDVHGGMLETSFMLHLRPELVKEFSHLEDVDISVRNPIKKIMQFKRGAELGYFGHPSRAESVIGKILLTDSIEIFYENLIKSINEKQHVLKIKSLSTDKVYMRTNFRKKVLSSTLWLTVTGIITYLLLKTEKSK